MSLTLDDVRSIRFPMAKRPNEGYRAIEVDNFVDKVEIAFSDFTDEQARLNALVESLQASAPSDGGANSAELARAKAEAEELRQQLGGLQADLERYRVDNDRMTSELQSAKAQVSAAHEGADSQLRNEINRLNNENGELRNQLMQVGHELEDARKQLRQTTQTSGFIPVIEEGVERIEVTTSPEAGVAVARMVALSVEQSERVTAEARAKADETIKNANAEAEQTTSSANYRAERTVTEAQANADRILQDAQANANFTIQSAKDEADRLTREAQENADRMFKETDQKRAELFTTLTQERDEMAYKVEKLKSYEDKYRQALRSHLSSQLEMLDRVGFAPSDRPELLNEIHNQSETPRLDALLADRQGR